MTGHHLQYFLRELLIRTHSSAMPDRYSYIDIGEKDYENPLPYDKIAPANYTPWNGYLDYDETIKKSKARMAQNKQLSLIEANAKWNRQRRDEKEVNHNFDGYSAEIDFRKDETKRFDSIDKYNNHLKFESLPYETALMVQDTTLVEKRKRWHKNLGKDIYVEEAVHVLGDLKVSSNKADKVADIKK